MAENIVEILVRSINDTRRGFEEAKKDAAKAGDDAGQSFAYRFGARLQTSFGSAATGGGGGILSSILGIATSSPEGLAVVTAAVESLIVEVDAVASGFAAAAAGAGAFYILGHNTIQQLTQDYGQLQTAQEAVQKAQNKYNLDPTKQNLKALQTAQLNQQTVQLGAQQDLGAAAPAVDKFATAMGNLQQQFQPQLFQTMSLVFTDLTKLLPLLLPLANAFAKAIDGLLTQFGKFASSKQFQDWFKQFLSLVGPSTTAIGQGLGQVAIAFGKLLTIMNNRDVVNAIRYMFDVIVFLLQALALNIKAAMVVWDWFWRNLKEAARSAAAAFRKFGMEIEDVVVGIIRWMEHAGAAIINGLARGIDDATGGLLTKMGGLASKITGFFGHVLGIGSPSKVFAEHGRNIVAGLVQGIQGSQGQAVNAVGRLAASVGMGGGGGYGGGGGGGVQVVFSGPGATQFQQLVRMMWPSLQLEVRNKGGGGPKSVQIALGQTH